MRCPPPNEGRKGSRDETDFFIDNLLVRILLMVGIFGKTGLAPWEFEFPFLGSLISTFLK